MKTKMKDAKSIQLGADALRAGKLVAFPTETVYGLGADARNPEAVKRIFEAKGRPSDHPLIVHLSSTEQMGEWAQHIPEAAWQLAEAFWPGPLTLILPRARSVLDVVTGGLDTVALRVPGHPMALELLKNFGSGIAAPSANRYGQVSPTSAEDVYEELEDRVDLILDGGRCLVGIESTIVDLSTQSPRILRPGTITQAMLSEVLGYSIDSIARSPQHYPGGDPSHYAPNARVLLATYDDFQKQIDDWQKKGLHVGVLSPQRPIPLEKNVIWLPFSEVMEEQAYSLYHSLRNADHLGVEVLIVLLPQDSGIGHALRDRLRRAAGMGERC